MLQKSLLTLFLVVGSLGLSFGQSFLKESNHWYFGDNAGIRFMDTATGVINPIALDDATDLDALEGSTAMSDLDGKLLFYVGSEGPSFGDEPAVVFNRQHTIMPNGGDIIGGSSSTQNAIAVRKPGSLTQYYIFSVAQDENTAADGLGFYYTLVDMTLDGGLGDVVDTVKNREIIDEADEKVSAVLHRNGRWVWVVSHRRNSRDYVAVLLTENGVSAPIISSVGTITQNGTTNCSRGALKISPNGNRVAMAVTEPITGGAHIMEVCRFNNQTGEVSDPITIRKTGNTGFGPYGVEFSPDNSKVYFSDRARGRIWKYDLCAGTGSTADIIASELFLASTSTPMTLQLGLDGKIYVCNSGTSLSTIETSNVAGGAGPSGFRQGSFRLATGTTADRGLTNVNQSIFNSLAASLDYTRLCENDEVLFSSEAACQGVVATFAWNFGDTASTANTSTEQYPRHQYTRPGRYNVKVIITSGNIIDSAERRITITARPRMRVLGDSLSCKVAGVYLLDQDTTLYKPTITDYYWRLTGVQSRFGTPSIDTIFKGRNFQEIQFPFDSNQRVYIRGLAYSTTTDGEQCASDTAGLYVVVNQRRGLTPTGLDSVCFVKGQPYSLNSTDSPRSRFRWVVTPTATVDSLSGVTSAAPGVYFSTFGPKQAYVEAYKDTVNLTCFTRSATHRFYMRNPPADSLYIVGDSSVCFEDSISYRVFLGEPGSRYTWSITQNASENVGIIKPGSNAEVLSIDYMAQGITPMRYGDNIYFVNVVETSRDKCTGSSFRHPIFNACTGPPNLITPNNDGFNDSFVIPNAERYADNELLIYNRYGSEVVNKKGFKNDFNSNDLLSGTYYYYFKVNVEGTVKTYKGWLEVSK